MTNPKYDYENVVVPWAVRISNNGEFIHGYAAVDLGAGQAERVARLREPVAGQREALLRQRDDRRPGGDRRQHRSSSAPKDGDYYDWALTWDQWLAKSA